MDGGVQELLLPCDTVVCFPEHLLAYCLRVHERVRIRNHETVIDEHESEKRNRLDIGLGGHHDIVLDISQDDGERLGHGFFNSSSARGPAKNGLM